MHITPGLAGEPGQATPHPVQLAVFFAWQNGPPPLSQHHEPESAQQMPE
jgi:hypothetical protein